MTGQFPISPASLVATLAGLLTAQGQTELASLIGAASPTIEATDYDNWNGGTYSYALHLELPVGLYAKHEAEVGALEALLLSKLRGALRKSGNDVLTTVVITPAFDDASAGAGSMTSGIDRERLWEPGKFRLFLCHVAAYKQAVSDLGHALDIYGVASFIAHEDIEPTLEWQAEIELALRTMHAMAALLTPGFHESNWTDQETGIAVGRGVLVIPVRLPLDPYGFIAKHQGMRGDLAKSPLLAGNIVDILLKRERTAGLMRSALLGALESVGSFASARAVTGKLETVGVLTDDEVRRIEAALASNDQVSASYGVPERLKRLVERRSKVASTSS